MSNILIQETLNVVSGTTLEITDVSGVTFLENYYYQILINNASYPLRPCAVANNIATIGFDGSSQSLYTFTLQQNRNNNKIYFTINVSGSLNLTVCGPFVSGGDIYITDDTNNGDTDFIGFVFNGVHSSHYNIVSISDGARYQQTLLPTIKDTITEKAGNGVYFFGSRYGERTFNITFAFDSISESDLRGLKVWLGDQKVHELIFDELPYRVFKAKVVSPPTFSFICFFENNQRRYKGDGTVTFISYESYAVQKYTEVLTSDNKTSYKRYHKVLNDYTNNNKSQWSASSGMLTSLNDGGRIVDSYVSANHSVQLFNAGDLEVPIKIYIKPITIVSQTGIKKFPIEYLQLCKLADDGSTVVDSTRLTFTDDFALPSADDSAVINSYNRLIEALRYNSTSQKIYKTGEVLNNYIGAGDFFNVPVGKSKIDVGFATEQETEIYEATISSSVKALNNNTGDFETISMGSYVYISAYTLENGVGYIDCFKSSVKMTESNIDDILEGTKYTFKTDLSEQITISYGSRTEAGYYIPKYNSADFLTNISKRGEDWAVMPFYYSSDVGYVPILAVEYPYYYL